MRTSAQHEAARPARRASAARRVATTPGRIRGGPTSAPGASSSSRAWWRPPGPPAAVCGRDATRARTAVHASAWARRSAPSPAWRRWLSSGEVDAVYVNTPTPPTPRPAWRAIGARCAVICEKPLAGSTAEAGALLRRDAPAAAPHGGQLHLPLRPRLPPHRAHPAPAGPGPPLRTARWPSCKGTPSCPATPATAPSWRAACTCWTPCWPSPVGPGWAG